MNVKNKSQEGIIYQIVDEVEGYDVVIDFEYSGGENGELEFVYAVAEEKSNPHLNEEELRIVNKVLECGQEESYVRALAAIYEREGIEFLTEHEI